MGFAVIFAVNLALYAPAIWKMKQDGVSASLKRF